ncbi:MAG: hypothetical protein ACOC5T_03655 [Elusimicrobiota bacterium]
MVFQSQKEKYYFPGQNRSILVIDRDSENQIKIKNTIQKINMKPVIVTDIDEAVCELRKDVSPIAVINFDSIEKSGENIKKSLKKEKDILQFIIIGSPEKHNCEAKYFHGDECEFITSPYPSDVLEEAIRKSYNRYKTLYSAMDYMDILIIDKDENTRREIEKNLSTTGVNIYEETNIDNLPMIIKNRNVDIIMLNMDFFAEQNKVLEDIIKFADDSGVIAIVESEKENVGLSALYMGASSYIVKPKDFENINKITKRIMESVKLKRNCRYKKGKIKKSNFLTARITDKKNIELEMMKPISKMSYSYARRFFDNIPVSIVAVDKSKNIVFTNRSFVKNCKRFPKSINENFIGAIKKMGIKDVSLDILLQEMEKLFSKKHDIETTIIGREEYLTLTNLTIKSEMDSKDMVLLIIRGN